MSFLDRLETMLDDYDRRLSWEEYFMAAAMIVKSRSPCERLKVGCVLVTPGNRIIASGYNGFPPGSPHRSCVVDGHEQNTIHAERNAIYDCARRGVSTEGAYAYVTHFPCLRCMQALLAAGVSKVYYWRNYKNDPLTETLVIESSISAFHIGPGDDDRPKDRMSD